MKNNLIYFILLLTFFTGTSTVRAEEAITDNLKLTYFGNVVLPPCTITTPSFNLDFGDILVNDMATSLAASEWQTATIHLDDCSEISSVTMTMTFTPDSHDPLLMASSGTAKNVAVENSGELLEISHVLNGKAVTIPMLAQKSYTKALRFRIRNNGAGATTSGTVISAMTITYTFK
ncbi:minor fimbrial subunit [Lelliottia nimipressuralis]|jgi:type 1 fimbria pilin|uniref:fimbrial protein n=1 Tax=Lelliottia nimipressuralis TaxID=69220 RepID=UPI003D1F5758